MIPDKIYFPEDGLPRYIDWDGSPIRTKQVEDSDICYIRKDVLLEWAKAEIKLSKMVEPVSEISYEKGRQQVAKNLIEKLNSM